MQVRTNGFIYGVEHYRPSLADIPEASPSLASRVSSLFKKILITIQQFVLNLFGCQKKTALITPTPSSPTLPKVDPLFQKAVTIRQNMNNAGNTCYLSALFQSLLNLPSFHKLLLQESTDKALICIKDFVKSLLESPARLDKKVTRIFRQKLYALGLRKNQGDKAAKDHAETDQRSISDAILFLQQALNMKQLQLIELPFRMTTEPDLQKIIEKLEQRLRNASPSKEPPEMLAINLNRLTKSVGKNNAPLPYTTELSFCESKYRLMAVTVNPSHDLTGHYKSYCWQESDGQEAIVCYDDLEKNVKIYKADSVIEEIQRDSDTYFYQKIS